MRRRAALPALSVCLWLSAGQTPAASSAARRAAYPPSSSAAAVSPDGSLVAAVNPDSGSVTFVDARSLAVVRELAVGADPRTLCFSADSRLLAVASRGSSDVSLVELPGFRTRRVGTRPAPFGVTIGGKTAFVSEFLSASVAAIDLGSGKVVARADTAPFPAGLALTPDGKSLLVTHFYSGKLSRLDAATLQVRDVVDAGGKNGNLSQSVVVSADGRKAYLPQTLSNVQAEPLGFDALHVPVVNVVDLASMAVLPRERVYLASIKRGANRPSSAALSPDGRYILVANAGSDDVVVAALDGGRALAAIDVGANPLALAAAPDGARVFVNNALDGTLSVIRGAALSGGDSASDFFVHKAVAFDLSGAVSCRSCHADADPAPLDSNLTMELAVGKLWLPSRSWALERIVALTKIPLPEAVLAGKRLFHSAARDDMSAHRWVSCASCHPDSGSDGRVWQGLSDGPRNTVGLFGLAQTAPYHWSGDFDELQDVEIGVRGLLFGRGLVPKGRRPADGSRLAGLSADLDALAAYLASLPVPAPPRASDEADVARGAAVFEKLACASCHAPPAYVDGKLHDVGTGAPGREKNPNGSRFDTPSLRALWRTPPYLHDGSAATLEDVLRRGPRHDVSSRLTDRERRDLTAFLGSL